ncbi:MAG: chromosome partitioning protein ParB [Rhodobacterales bacterium]|nr:MAG: chromosome partitioning protein ParB [Rhodobacterales bacterium]
MANPPKNRGLGRGLSALMSDIDGDSSSSSDAPRKPESRIAIELIHPNPDQPRRSFNEDALSELADSIRAKGIIQPLILRPDPQKVGEYQIVAGERRWRAAQRAELHDVPAIIRELDDTEVLEVAIIENIQRADLNAIDEAQGYQQLMDRFGHTQEHLAVALGKSRSHIANLLRLLSLPEDVRRSVVDGKLTAGHARTLVGRENASDLAREIISKGLSVRAAERLTAKPKADAPRKAPTKTKDADTVQIENELSAQLGMRATIDPDFQGESGRLTLRYRDLGQLDDLLRLLGGM